MSIRSDDIARADRSAPSLAPGYAIPDAATPAAATLCAAAALARAQTGDRAAFRVLVLTHQARVYSLALRMLGRREDAQELAQDVFLSLHRNLTSIASPEHLRHWLHRTVCHRSIDRLRSRTAPQLLPLEAAAAVEDPVGYGDPAEQRLLRGLIEQLQPMARAAMLLRYQEDLDPGEIARVLGLPLNTIKSHLRRSLIWMRQRISQLHCVAGGGADD